jgi:hypothetical protein
MNLTEDTGYKLVKDDKGIVYVSIQPLILELEKQEDCIQKQIVLDYLYALLEQFINGENK